jgi:predicted Zn finger-like uncharacterized protein
MKIQCPHCKSVYDLDDKKIPNKKIKFKCRKCQKHVYINKDKDSAGASASGKQMVCPKCGREQAVSDECVHCGTTVIKPGRDAKPNGDPAPPPPPGPEPPSRDNVATKDEDVVYCPKCAFELRSSDLECINCGIVIEKYKAFEAKKKQAEEESQQQTADAPDQEQTPANTEKVLNEKGASSDPAQ